MKAHITKNLFPEDPMWQGIPDRLFLHAENDQERELIERIEREYITTNYGRGNHVGVELRPVTKDEDDGS